MGHLNADIVKPSPLLSIYQFLPSYHNDPIQIERSIAPTLTNLLDQPPRHVSFAVSQFVKHILADLLTCHHPRV